MYIIIIMYNIIYQTIFTRTEKRYFTDQANTPAYEQLTDLLMSLWLLIMLGVVHVQYDETNLGVLSDRKDDRKKKIKKYTVRILYFKCSK